MAEFPVDAEVPIAVVAPDSELGAFVDGDVPTVFAEPCPKVVKRFCKNEVTSCVI